MAGRHRAMSKRSKVLRGIPVAMALPAAVSLGDAGAATAQTAPAQAVETAPEIGGLVHATQASATLPDRFVPSSAVSNPVTEPVEPIAAQPLPQAAPVAQATPVAHATAIASPNENGTFIGQTAGQVIGGVTGAVVGGTVGAALATSLAALTGGAAVPIGVVTGGVIGGVVGTYAGYYAGSFIGSAVAEAAPQIIPNVLP